MYDFSIGVSLNDFGGSPWTSSFTLFWKGTPAIRSWSQDPGWVGNRRQFLIPRLSMKAAKFTSCTGLSAIPMNRYLGMPAARDGFHIDERLTYPDILSTGAYGGASLLSLSADDHHVTYLLAENGEAEEEKVKEVAYISGGGGTGGCEDPRLTRIGDRIYMTYVAYDGYSPPRVALTSISASIFSPGDGAGSGRYLSPAPASLTRMPAFCRRRLDRNTLYSIVFIPISSSILSTI